MALTVATNTGALMAQAAASSVNKDMETSMERLSTGKRINGAADDAAGVAIASRLDSEVRGMNQAIRNAMDGQAMIDTAEGAHIEIENILQRMRELAVQAANDTNSTSDRTNLQSELNQLAVEIDRIASVSSWAGKTLLNAGAAAGSIAATQDDTTSFSFQVGSGTSSSDSVTATISAMDTLSLGVRGEVELSVTTSSVSDASATSGGTASSDSLAVSNGVFTFTRTAQTGGSGGDAGDHSTGDYVVSIAGQSVTVTAASGDSASAAGDALVTAIAANSSLAALGITGTNSSGAVTIAYSPSKLSLSSMSNAQTAITAIDAAITDVNTQRATLGAISNRLDSTVANLTNASSNLAAGRGRIEDADFAAETTSLAKSQILQQASTAMLAQANASKQNVLSLLQG
jgi:flagellin